MMYQKFALAVFIVLSSFATGQKTPVVKIDSLLKKGDAQMLAVENDSALATYTAAKNIAQAQHLPARVFDADISIANLYTMSVKFDLAGRFYKNQYPSLDLPPRIISRYYHRKAFYYDQTDVLDSVVANASKGLEIAKKYNFVDDQILLYNELGYVYSKFKNWDLARQNYDKALRLSKEGTELYYSIILNKARLTAQNDPAAGIRILKSSISKIKNKGWYRKQMDMATMLSELYAKVGDSANYYKYHSMEATLYNTILSRDKDKSYNNLLLKYQTKQKDQEIAQKEKKSRWLSALSLLLAVLIVIALIITAVFQKKNKQLGILLNNNNILIGELNHRVKNNLQLIVALTARETSKADHTRISGLVNLSTKIESIASLHKQLYTQGDIHHIAMHPFLEDITTHLAAILEQRSIKLHAAIDDFQINSDTAMYIGLLINELIINSVKHAFAEGSDKIITLSVAKEQRHITIDYSDSGKGIPDGVLPKLVGTLSRQIDAEFTVAQGAGFRYKARKKI